MMGAVSDVVERGSDEDAGRACPGLARGACVTFHYRIERCPYYFKRIPYSFHRLISLGCYIIVRMSDKTCSTVTKIAIQLKDNTTIFILDQLVIKNLFIVF